MFKYLVPLVFALCIVDCGSAAPVGAAYKKTAPTSSAASNANGGDKAEDGIAATVNKQDSAKIYNVGAGLGAQRPSYGSPAYPTNSIPYTQPNSYPQHSVPDVRPVAYYKPWYYVPNAAVPPASPPIPALSGATYYKPSAYFEEKRPGYTVAQQIIHKPFVTEQVQVIRRPVVAEFIQIVHKPILTEVQQVIRQPLYTQHVVKKPLYNTVKQEVQQAPLHLNYEHQHVVAKPVQQFIQLPVQQVPPPINTETVNHVHVPTNTPAVPVAPVPALSASHYDYGSYEGYGNGQEYYSSYLSPYACSAGECGGINKDGDRREVIVPPSSSFVDPQPSTPLSNSNVPADQYSNYATLQPSSYVVAVPYEISPYISTQQPQANVESEDVGRHDGELVGSGMSRKNNFQVKEEEEEAAEIARTLLQNSSFRKSVEEIISGGVSDNNARDAMQNELNEMMEKIQKFDDKTRSKLLEQLNKLTSTDKPSSVKNTENVNEKLVTISSNVN